MIGARGKTESTVLVLTVCSVITAGTFPEQEREKKGAIPRVCCFSLPQNHAAQQWYAWYRTATQPCPHSPKAPPPASKFRTFRKSPLRSLGPTFSSAGLTLKLCQVAQSFLLIFSISRNGNFIATYFNVQPPSLIFFLIVGIYLVEQPVSWMHTWKHLSCL